jgi:hypothetical protein
MSKLTGAAYRLYSLLLPIMRLISKLDGFLPRDRVYAVIVTATRGAPATGAEG